MDIKVLRNFKDELPLDSFSPLICFNQEDLIAVEFNLTGPAIIDVPSQYSVTGFDSESESPTVGVLPYNMVYVTPMTWTFENLEKF